MGDSTVVAVSFALSCLVLTATCEEIVLNGSRTCEDFDTGDSYRPTSPRVLCCLL